MQFIHDHLVSALIAGAVVLLLGSSMVLRQRSALDAVGFSAGAANGDVIKEVLTQELSNIGAGVPAGEPRLLLSSNDSAAFAFEFRGAVAPTATAPVERVLYRLERAGTEEVAVGGTVETLTTYSLGRYVLEGGAYRQTWASAPVVTELSVELVGVDGVPVGASLDAAREGRVSLAYVSPLRTDGPVPVRRWHRRFQIAPPLAP